MLFPPTLLTLLTLLEALGGSRTVSALTEDQEDVEDANSYHYSNARCVHEPRRPTIAATTATNKSYRNYKQTVYLDATYGEDVVLSCSSSDASNLTIRYSKQQFQAKRFNLSTVQMTFKNPDVGRHECHCMDTITGCVDTLLVSVEPVISVTAPGILHKLVHSFDHVYFVPRGEDYHVSCSGGKADVYIVVELDRWQKLQAKEVNETTVTATVTGDTTGQRYSCKGSNGMSKTYPIRIIVDHYPEAREFRCVLFQARKLECTWRSLSKRHSFELFYMDTHERVHLCSDKSGDAAGGCASAWEGDIIDYEFESEFTLQLHTCVEVFCHNQLFRMPLGSIKKLNPVYNLRIVNADSRGAAVAWHHDVWFGDCAYRVEYRLLGTEWRPVNVSAVRCGDECELPLALPCPDSHYELRVYVRYKQADEDRFWSDPSSIFFFTAPSTGDEAGSACDTEFREQEPTPSAEVVLYVVRELISDERKETKFLKKKVDALKEKLATVNALMDERAGSG